MNKEDRDAILRAAAKTLAWELFDAAGYGRPRTGISVERFGRTLLSLARQWSVTERNLTKRKEH
jgi:hypothetical protein